MTSDPKTPAQRLARVFRILAVLAERGDSSHEMRQAVWWAQCAINNMTLKLPMRHAIMRAERHLKKACRAAGIDPESIT